MAKPDPKFYFAKLEKLQSERSSLDSIWEDLSKYVLPRKDNIITEKSAGDVIDSDIFDFTAIESNNIMAAGLHGYLTNPASRWFGLTLENTNLMSDYSVKTWLHEAEQKTFDVFNSTNFHNTIICNSNNHCFERTPS